MKYRQLTYKELTVMQEDFSDFLYTQGFSRFDWRVLQEQHSEQAVNLLGEYSDQTFDKVMQSIEYLEYRTPKVLYAYHCQKEQMEIIGLQAPTSSELDFTSMLSLDETNCSEIMAYKSFVHLKPYKLEREHELFNMIEKGYYVSDASNFKFLKRLRSAFQN